MPAVPKRLYIIDELYQTETSYITDLKTLNHDIVRMLSEGSLTRSERVFLESYQMILDDFLKFQALPNFIETKNDMKALLDKTIKTKDHAAQELTANEIAQLENSASEKEAKLIQDFNKAGKHFETLGFLTSTYFLSFGLITKLSEKPFFQDFLAKESAIDQKETIGSQLIKPVQRLPRYKLLLEDLVKNTSGEQKEALVTLLRNLKEKADAVNARGGKSEAEEKLILLDAYASNKIEKLVQVINRDANFNRVDTLEVLKKDLLDAIKKIADNKDLNSLEKLHQIKSTLGKRNYKRVVPQAARRDFEKSYNIFRPVFIKHVFNRQSSSLSELRQQNRESERKIGKPDKNADEERLNQQIAGYKEAIDALKKEQKLQTQAAKFRRMSSPVQLITRLYTRRKIAEYSRSLRRLEQQVKKLEQINLRTEAPQDAIPERPSPPSRPETPKPSEPLPPHERPEIVSLAQKPQVSKPVPPPVPSREGRPALSGKPVPPPRPARPDLQKESKSVPPPRPARPKGGFFDKPGATVNRQPPPPLPTKMKGPTPGKKGS